MRPGYAAAALVAIEPSSLILPAKGGCGANTVLRLPLWFLKVQDLGA